MEQVIKPAESAENFISAMGLAATGVSVVTTDGEAGRFGLTFSAISPVHRSFSPASTGKARRWPR